MQMTNENRHGEHGSSSGDSSEVRARIVHLISPRFNRRRAGSAVHLNPDQKRFVREVREKISDGRYLLLSAPCPCGENRGSIIARTERYGLPLDTLMCPTCGTLRFDPYLSDEALKGFYVDYYQAMYGRAPNPDTYVKRQASYGNRLLPVIARYFGKDARIAEIGCGAGGALAVLRVAGYRVTGCDYSEPLLEIGRSMGLDDLRFGGAEMLVDPFTSEKYDVVLLHHVFEHLPDPVRLLRMLKPVLSERGMVIVAVPDVTRINDFPFPSGNLRLFLHIAHKFNFTLKGIDAIARAAGLLAFSLEIEKSAEAPEFWVGFGLAAHPPLSWQGTLHGEPKALLAYLHSVERRFIVRAIREKMSRLFGRNNRRPS